MQCALRRRCAALITIPGTLLGVTCDRARVPRAAIAALAAMKKPPNCDKANEAFKGLREATKNQTFVTPA